MRPTFEAILLMAAIGLFSSILTCAALYIFWLRRTLRDLLRLQLTLEQARGFPTSSRPEDGPPPKDSLVARLQLKSGSGSISVYDAGGKNIVRIDGSASPQEKEQLLRYLKSEGFL